MSDDIRCTDLGKRYRLRHARRGAAAWLRKPAFEDFWALRHIEIGIASGDAVGVIGHNGAGKSTLLKLLSGITAPTEGEIRMRGRISALIELGSGFHPELTGRENVFLSGTILGMRRREIAERLDSIVEFAGVGGFLDVPVKWYSSGMFVRLGFSIAAHLEADILLVDEVLAVGDAEFQARCFRRIHDLRTRGTTIVLISHDLGTVERMCRRAILLEHGRIAAEGEARDVVTTYQRSVAGSDAPSGAASDLREAPVSILGLRVLDAAGVASGVARTGEPVSIELELRAWESMTDIVAAVMTYSYDEGVLLFECTTPLDGIPLQQGGHSIRFHLESLGLLPGVYTLGAIVRPANTSGAIDWWFGRTTLHVDSGPAARGQFHAPYRWSLARAAGAPAAPLTDAARDQRARASTR